MSDDKQHLDYAVPSRRFISKRAVRIILGTLAALICAGLLYVMLPDILLRYRAFKATSQCRDFQLPLTTIVYGEGSTIPASISSDPRYESLDDNRFFAHRYAICLPDCWTEMQDLEIPSWAPNPSFGIFVDALPPDCLLFLHQLQVRGNPKITRIVAFGPRVRGPSLECDDGRLEYSYSVIEGRDGLQFPREVATEPAGVTDRPKIGRELIFYAGTTDRSDPSSFSVPYDLDGVRMEIHGTLESDGATVKFTNIPP